MLPAWGGGCVYEKPKRCGSRMKRGVMTNLSRLREGVVWVRQSHCTYMEDGIEHRVPSARVSPEGTLEPAQHGAAHFNTSTQEQTHLSDHTGGLSGSAAIQDSRTSLEHAGEDRVLLQAAVSPDVSEGQPSG